ncbi:MAG: MetQ/NlpA family ABC transporter substrate-binding protein [Alphaproteobacteria bacterium]|jgi:D-methionine transport system substrate-binding protein|nr:MetQ/NlpA family ABC transporter substrate-binding protein [Alphaproteobacteria bacterium]
MFKLTRRLALIAAVALATLPAMAQDKPLKIGVSSGPYGDILRETAKLAAKEGLQAEIVEFTEWTQINEALQLGDIDANNFQHVPYLDNQKKQRGYKIVPLVPSIVVPTGLYSAKAATVDAIPAGAKIGIPNDPSNSARALFLLQQAGLIKLKPGVDVGATAADIVENPKKISLIELDAAQLPRSLNDLGAAVITLNYAVLAKLDPKKALVLEGPESRWTLVWAVREDRKDDPRIRRFVELYRSPEIKSFILTKFDGTILPTW